MSYCTPDEVSQDFKDIEFLDGEGNISLQDVTQMIVESDALINSYVGNVYIVPVITGAGLDLLKLLSRSLTALRIKKVMEVVQKTSDDANQNVLTTLMSLKDVLKVLTDIKNQDAALPGAILLSSDGGFFNNNVANRVCPKIRKDETQW
jgi:hypothetical protein